MKLIAHRGASSLTLENSLEAIHAAVAAGVDAVELDARLTGDGQFVICHDASTGRVASGDRVIHTSELAQLKALKLTNGEALPTLAEAVKALAGTPLFLEMKDAGWADQLAQVIATIPTVTVIAFNHTELLRFHKQAPQVPCLLLENRHAFKALRLARQHSLSGVDLKFWLLNPFTYWFARRHKLTLAVYTVNTPWLALFIRIVCPRVLVATDMPQKMQWLRPRKQL